MKAPESALDAQPATLTSSLAEQFARIALGHVAREYPNAPQHVLASPRDALTPRELHPVFFGSFDWHSCVHGYWLLARLLRAVPEIASAPEIRARFDALFTPERIAGERAYLDRPQSVGFERPYGWAWLLMLAAELSRGAGPGARVWQRALAPLAAHIGERFEAFLPKADYPVRAGVHGNTAFALALAIDYAQAVGDDSLLAVATAKARAWYENDAGCQAWEPSGDDFLSPALMEAELMRRVLEPRDFQAWFRAFLPEAGRGAPATLFTPARVSDRSDGKIAHLDGLNLSRAWCWRGIARALAKDDPLCGRAAEAADRHLKVSLPQVAGDYMGEHWLASFALLAILA